MTPVLLLLRLSRQQKCQGRKERGRGGIKRIVVNKSCDQCNRRMKISP